MRTSIAFSVGHCGLSVLLLGGLSVLSDLPLVLPAVGASAYVVFADPAAPTAAPRNVLVGHALGAGIGWGLLLLLGLAGEPSGLASPLSWQRVAAVAGSLAITIGALRALACSHPPAGATTMIVAMGLLPEARHLPAFALAGGVVVLHANLALRLMRRRAAAGPGTTA